jgi:hypothetical protein
VQLREEGRVSNTGFSGLVSPSKRARAARDRSEVVTCVRKIMDVDATESGLLPTREPR